MPLLPALQRAVRRSDFDPTTDQAQAFVRDQADMDEHRVERYTRYQDLYDGEKRIQLTLKQRLWLEDCGIPFGENFIATVVDKLAARLRIEGFQVQDDDAASKWLTTTVWPKNQGGVLQRTIHTNAPMLGDAFTLVFWDEEAGRPRWRYLRPHNVKPTYDHETGDMSMAAWLWATSTRSPTNPTGLLINRLNIYRPDRVEKWFSISKDGDWLPHLDDGDETWPVWWTSDSTETADPLGLPVFHFKHRPLGNDYGRSRVKRAAPFQAEIHKQLIDLFDVMDEQGWKQRYASGITSEETLKIKPGDVLTARAPDARFGEFSAENPIPLADTILGTLKRMAAATNTPMHDLISGQPPSGEALKTAESGLTEDAHDDQESYTPPWSGMGGLSLRLQAAFGEAIPGVKGDPDAEITVVWDDPQTRNEKDEADTALMYSELGVSNHTLLRRLGFDPDEEQKLKAKEQPAAPPPPDAPPVPPALPAGDPPAPAS